MEVHKHFFEEKFIKSSNTETNAGRIGASIFAGNPEFASSVGIIASCVISYNKDPTDEKGTRAGDMATTRKVGETTFEASLAKEYVENVALP